MWKHWRTGELWESEGTYIVHLLLNPKVYSESARKGIQRYYEKLRQ